MPSKSMPKAAGKKRERKQVAHVVFKPTSMRRDDATDEEEQAENPPPPKQQKLMGDAIKTVAPSKAKPAAAKPKRTTRDVPASEKNKAPVPEREAEEDEEAPVLMKLRPKLPEHNDAHPVVENMKKRKDAGLRKWRESDPYSIRRRTAVDYRFYTKEQQDFYETVLLDKKPIVSDMKWVDWKYIDANEDYFPHVHEDFRSIDLDEFIGKKLTN